MWFRFFVSSWIASKIFLWSLSPPHYHPPTLNNNKCWHFAKAKTLQNKTGSDVKIIVILPYTFVDLILLLFPLCTFLPMCLQPFTYFTKLFQYVIKVFEQVINFLKLRNVVDSGIQGCLGVKPSLWIAECFPKNQYFGH